MVLTNFKLKWVNFSFYTKIWRQCVGRNKFRIQSNSSNVRDYNFVFSLAIKNIHRTTKMPPNSNVKIYSKVDALQIHFKNKISIPDFFQSNITFLYKKKRVWFLLSVRSFQHLNLRKMIPIQIGHLDLAEKDHTDSSRVEFLSRLSTLV